MKKLKENVLYLLFLIELAILVVVTILLFISFDYQTAFYGAIDFIFIIFTYAAIFFIGLKKPVPPDHEQY